MLVARAGLSPVMVGRVAELNRLRSLEAASGEARVAWVSGEAGAGKTRLVRELLAGLAPGTRVFSARAEEGATGRPYGLLLQAVAADVAGWARVPEPLRADEDALGTLLAPVAPELGAPDRRYAADELLRAAVALIRHLAGGSPAVLVLEDLHWADTDSLIALHRLAVTPGLDVLVVGTFRPEDIDRRSVADPLAAVERDRHVEHITLDRLSVEEVATFVAAVRRTEVDWATAAALHRRTGGNPFFLEELLVAAGDVPVTELETQPLPVTLTEAVIGHLDGLDEEQRQVADAAAILGQRIPFDLLTSVTGLGEDALVAALRALVQRGLLVEDTDDVFTFRHALTREAVVGRLLGRERRRLHEKALVAMQEAGSDDWSALAHHANEAGRYDEMLDAARRGARRYLRGGATYEALRLAEMGLSETEADAELLELATLAAWSVGLKVSALERAEQWRRHEVAVGDDAATARALRVLARLRWEAGDEKGHRETVEQALDVATRLEPGVDVAWLYNLAAEAAMLEMRTDAAVEWADRALEAAGTDPPPALRGAIDVNKGTALYDTPGFEDEGERLLEEGLELSDTAGDFLTALRACNNLAFKAFPQWEPARTAALLDRMGALLERGGRQDWRPAWHLLRGIFLAHVQGDLTGARDELAAAAATGVQQRERRLFDVEIDLESGDLAGAAALLAAAAAPTRNKSQSSEGDRHSLLARLAARRGDLQGARAELEAMAEAARTSPETLHHLSDAWYHALTEAVELGLPPATADELMASLDPPPTPAGRSGDPLWPEHLQAVLAERRGDPADAAAHFERAAATGGWRRSVPDRAAALLGLARCRLALEDTAGATGAARQARDLLRRWPGWRRDQADALLRRLGAGPAPRAVAGTAAAALTPRELEVARLVAAGMSNGEIGRQLFISTKTASVHVSAILRKLQMSSRAEVAAYMARLDRAAR